MADVLTARVGRRRPGPEMSERRIDQVRIQLSGGDVVEGALQRQVQQLRRGRLH